MPVAKEPAEVSAQAAIAMSAGTHVQGTHRLIRRKVMQTLRRTRPEKGAKNLGRSGHLRPNTTGYGTRFAGALARLLVARGGRTLSAFNVRSGIPSLVRRLCNTMPTGTSPRSLAAW
jgi:hypothetical protein